MANGNGSTPRMALGSIILAGLIGLVSGIAGSILMTEVRLATLSGDLELIRAHLTYVQRQADTIQRIVEQRTETFERLRQTDEQLRWRLQQVELRLNAQTKSQTQMDIYREDN
jgi:cobalamin biosynthesis protein CbiD